MGYDLGFDGLLIISPALSQARVTALTIFARTGRTPIEPYGEALPRREPDGNHLEGPTDSALAPRAAGQPAQRCCWRPTPDGLSLEWDGCEKFGQYQAWVSYLILTFFRPWGCQLDGRIRWRGEDQATGTLVVTANEVRDEPDHVEPAGSADDDTRVWLRALRGRDAGLRLTAARELHCAVNAAALVQAEAVAALVAVLSERDLTKQALETLGELGRAAETAVEPATAVLLDADHQVRYWATFALGRLGPAARVAIPALKKLTTDSEYGPRCGAIDALKRLGIE